jgi:hypothetical protein
MKKKEKKKVVSGREVVNLEQLVKKNFDNIMMGGIDLGNVLIKTYSHVLTNYESFGVVAVGLAKAVAALESTANLHGVDVEALFNYTLKTFKEQYQEENK